MTPPRRPGCITFAVSAVLGSFAIYRVVYAGIGLVTGQTVATMGKLRSRREIPLSGDPARWFSIFELIFALGLLLVAVAFATADEGAASKRLKIALGAVLVGFIGMLWIAWPAL